jgi:hypothetical protein
VSAPAFDRKDLSKPVLPDFAKVGARSGQVETGTLIKAMAISWVVFSHAGLGTEEYGFTLAGGMSYLMFFSGYSFARFSLVNKSDREIRASCLNTVRTFLVPSFFLMLFSFVWARKFDILELFYISNFFYKAKISYFPMWYVQVIIQMSLIFYGLFSLKPFARTFRAQPFWTSLALVAASIILIRLTGFNWITDNRLPWFYIWLYALGWVVYFAMQEFEPDTRGKAIASALVVLVPAYVYGWSSEILRPFWPIIGGLVLIWAPSVSLPAFAKAAVTLVSRSTFFLFFLHAFAFGVLGLVFQRLFGDKEVHFLLRWPVAMASCICLWAVCTAALRAYRKRRRHLLDKALAPST